MCSVCGNHEGSHFILVGGRGLVVYYATTRKDVETFQSNVVANTFIRQVSREYNRGDRFC
jgi:hypothetical protein